MEITTVSASFVPSGETFPPLRCFPGLNCLSFAQVLQLVHAADCSHGNQNADSQIKSNHNRRDTQEKRRIDQHVFLRGSAHPEQNEPYTGNGRRCAKQNRQDELQQHFR